MSDNMDKFWISFKAWFEKELPDAKFLKQNYAGGYYDFGEWYNTIEIDFEHIYNLHYGKSWKNPFSTDSISQNEFKELIEILYSECIENRYAFTIDVNTRLRKFNIPLKLNSGKLVKSEYKGTNNITSKILNYNMLERKISFSEEMIWSKEILDKKTALDYIVDSLQYLISIEKGNSLAEKKKNVAVSIGYHNNSKIYATISKEIEQVLAISNEYFDIRHNEYLNKSQEKREALNDIVFIEYLYNRVYSLVQIIKLKFKQEEKQNEQ